MRDRIRTWLPTFGNACLVTMATAAGPVLFTLAVTIVQAIQPGYNTLGDTISQLVLGPYGWLVRLCIILYSFLFGVFALRLYSVTGRQLTIKAGVTLLVMMAIGFLVVGVFPTREAGAPLTLGALAHQVTAAALIGLFPVACFLVAPSLARDLGWSQLSLYTYSAGGVAVVLLIVGIVGPKDSPYAGLHERLVALNGLVWTEVLSIRLLRYCARARAPTPVVGDRMSEVESDEILQSVRTAVIPQVPAAPGLESPQSSAPVSASVMSTTDTIRKEDSQSRN